MRESTAARFGLAPQCLGELVAWDLAVPVDDQIAEQQPSLSAGQVRVEALAVAFDGQRTAELDPQCGRRRQGHANHLGNSSGRGDYSAAGGKEAG